MPAHMDIPLTPQHLAMREPGPLRGALARCNAQLPPSIRVVALAPAPRGWHAQFSALGKTYLYQVHVAPAPDPLLRRTHYHCASRRALRALPPPPRPYCCPYPCPYCIPPPSLRREVRCSNRGPAVLPPDQCATRRRPLDVGAMRAAAAALHGTHDFTSFTNADPVPPPPPHPFSVLTGQVSSLPSY